MSSESLSLVRRFEIRKVIEGSAQRVLDQVAVEEPLDISLKYWFKDVQTTINLAVTMRTPGDDKELTAGYLMSEGIVQGSEQIIDIRHLGVAPSNEVIAELGPDVDVDAWRLARNNFLSASCGICGKRSSGVLASQIGELDTAGVKVSASLIEGLPRLLETCQRGFAQTGGLHAAALISCEGELEAAFEDIGRHNALDKLIGHAVLGGLTPLRDRIVLLSSRSSFELIQKAGMAGVPILATVGGPSSLAIEAARDCGMTLIGFVRESRFNVYSGEWRLNS
jgi:FdhD protein